MAFPPSPVSQEEAGERELVDQFPVDEQRRSSNPLLLDTVMTMVDRDTFTVFRSLLGRSTPTC